MNLIKQNDASKAIQLYMADSTAPLSGKTGLTLTVRIAKNGGAFAAGGGTVAEQEGGFYAYTPTSGDTNTLGPLAIRATATGAVDCPAVRQVVAFDPYAASNLGLTALPGTGTLAVTPTLAATQAFNNTGQTSNLPADVQTIKTQAVTAAGAVTFPGSIGTSTFAAGGNVNASSIGGQVVTASTGITFAATVGTSTYAGGDTSGTTTLLSRLPSALTIAAGKVAATIASGDNADKAGYSLTQAFPANFSVLAITPTTGYVTAGTVNDKTGYSGTATNLPADYQQRGVAVTLPATLPAASINTAAFAAGATLPRVTLADTVTTYTGNTPQTGDAFARLGAPTGVSIAADIQTRSTYAGGAVASVTGSVGSVTSPVTVNAINGQAPPTNWSIMVVNGSGYVTTSNPATGGSAVTEATIWAYATRTLSDKTGFALTTAYDPAKTAAQAGNAMTLTTGERSAIATAVLTDTTALDLATAGSLGHIVTTAPGWYTAPPSVSGLATSSALSALATTVGTAGAGLTGIPYTGPNVAAIQSGLATASQIPASFTAGTFASPGVFAAAALANAPTGSGGTFPATAPANWITTAAYAAGAVVPANVIQIAGSATAATNLSADEAAAVPAGFGSWSLPQTIRAVAAVLFGKRTGVPAAGSGGTVTITDGASSPVSYGTITYDASGNVTALNLTPPA